MPRLAEAEAGQRVVYFVDAAHFVYGAFLGYVWCFTRVFVQSPSGRQRFNVLGAVNAVTHQILMVTNETYITASSVCELLWNIANQNLTVPVTVVLDNARYQHCRAVESFAAFLGIELLFLPSYSPNLNLIERLWKFVKKQCLYSHYYSSFELFKGAIATCLATAHTTHQAKLDSLLTLRFQTFPDLSPDSQLLVFPISDIEENSQPMAA